MNETNTIFSNRSFKNMILYLSKDQLLDSFSGTGNDLGIHTVEQHFYWDSRYYNVNIDEINKDI